MKKIKKFQVLVCIKSNPSALILRSYLYDNIFRWVQFILAQGSKGKLEVANLFLTDYIQIYMHLDGFGHSQF